jgi:hypothetical protein
MARITTNTTGTQPVITLSTQAAGDLVIPFIQDVTITNSTGVYAYTTFSDADKLKLSTPADNEVSTNIEIDNEAFFGNSAATANSAAYLGLIGLSGTKTAVDFEIQWSGSGGYTSSGVGFITSIAAKTSPEAPVWVTPLNIAVDGGFTTVD